jgi:hypothetical protein
MLHGLPSRIFHSNLTSGRLPSLSSTLITPALADKNYPVLPLFGSAKIKAVPMLDRIAGLIEPSKTAGCVSTSDCHPILLKNSAG